MKAAVVVVLGALLLGGCASWTRNDPAPRTSSSVLASGPTPSADVPDLCPPIGSAATPGEKVVPSVTLHCLASDERRNLRRLAGRPLVLNFWASWCGPCKVELPLLARAHREWGDQVDFLGIDVQDASGPAWATLTEAGVRYPQLEDPRGVTRVPFGWTSGLPMTVFIDAHGRMVGTERTSFRTYAELTDALRQQVGPFDQPRNREDG